MLNIISIKLIRRGLTLPVGMDLKKYRNKPEMKECKMTTLHLQKIHYRCFPMFFHLCLVSVLFSGPPLLEMKSSRSFFLVSVILRASSTNIQIKVVSGWSLLLTSEYGYLQYECIYRCRQYCIQVSVTHTQLATSDFQTELMSR